MIFSDCHSDIGIGFVTKSTPLCHQMPGKFPGTFAYFNDGLFYGQFPGEAAFNKSFISDAKFRAGDIVGVVIGLASKQIIFTKNGVRLKTKSTYYVHSTDDLHPAVSLFNPGDEIEANFGPNFKHNIFMNKSI
ncbi:hypothetical protein niasHT_035298 [Heterodera trifolii]|uniref:B30.2/SPRY domain-containing protein n=1 Tax=Heterodera trifolii TaxID=157864 RepID=A0ABD2I1P4_9BILA